MARNLWGRKSAVFQSAHTGFFLRRRSPDAGKSVHGERQPLPRGHDGPPQPSAMRSLGKLEESHIPLGQHAKGWGGLKRALDPGLNLIPFKEDVVAISLRIVPLANATRMDWKNVGGSVPIRCSLILTVTEHLTFSGLYTNIIPLRDEVPRTSSPHPHIALIILPPVIFFLP